MDLLITNVSFFIVLYILLSMYSCDRHTVHYDKIHYRHLFIRFKGFSLNYKLKLLLLQQFLGFFFYQIVHNFGIVTLPLTSCSKVDKFEILRHF